MSIYKQIKNPRGQVRYLKSTEIGKREDGSPKVKTRMVSKSKIPANIIRELEGGASEVNDEGLALEAPIKECIFCGVACKHFRLVNGQTVALCEEHYYSTNIGQIAQRLRENEDGKS